jgi:hypothetical protein
MYLHVGSKCANISEANNASIFSVEEHVKQANRQIENGKPI